MVSTRSCPLTHTLSGSLSLKTVCPVMPVVTAHRDSMSKFRHAGEGLCEEQTVHCLIMSHPSVTGKPLLSRSKCTPVVA